MKKNSILFLFPFMLLTSCRLHKKNARISSTYVHEKPLTHASFKKLETELYAWIGTPYKYGGNNKKGVDCSGFVCAIYSLVFELKLPRTSKEQFAKSKPIVFENLQEGDLVFFDFEGKGVSHVGIYVGEHKFVHASSSQGVIQSELNAAYYKQHFVRGGRYLP